MLEIHRQRAPTIAVQIRKTATIHFVFVHSEIPTPKSFGERHRNFAAENGFVKLERFFELLLKFKYRVVCAIVFVFLSLCCTDKTISYRLYTIHSEMR